MASQAQYQQAPPPRRRDDESSQRTDNSPAHRREEYAVRPSREPERVFPDPKTGLTAAQAAYFLEQ